MAEHLTPEQMNGYAQRTLAPGALLAADNHLQTCAACREKLGGEAGLETAIRSLRMAVAASPDEAAHLTYEQLEAHIEGSPGRTERKIMEAHLGLCDQCAAEARDLAEFTRSARAGGEEIGRTPPAVRRFPAPALLLALAAAVVVAVATAWLVPTALRRQVGHLTDQIGDLQRRNEALSQQAAQAETLRAELERLRPGTSAPPPAWSESGISTTTVTLNDRRGPVGLDANGDLIGLDALTVSEGRVIASALRSSQAETPADLQDLIGAPEVLLGEPEKQSSLGPFSPAGTVVRDTRPVFSWRPLPGADSYSVAVYDTEFHPITRSESLARTSWTPSRPLRRDALYVWQVIARRGDEEITSPAPPAPEARFKILGGTESAALDRALRETGGSHLAAGVLLARVGCVDDARKEFQALLEQNPDSQVARDLMKSVAGTHPRSR